MIVSGTRTVTNAVIAPTTRLVMSSVMEPVIRCVAPPAAPGGTRFVTVVNETFPPIGKGPARGRALLQ